MNKVRTKKALVSYLDHARKQGLSIGFVPTMGCLHAGHLSLVRRARKENDIVVVSIFVNPLQFGKNEDFTQYPRVEKQDAALCKKAGVDIVYLPDQKTFYGEHFYTTVHVSHITNTLCGAVREGHFDGVATVVLKLFQQIQPTRAYFGQKDYQQVIVIKQLVRDLDCDVKICVCPIVRESDGLALSSRNTYLSGQERVNATCIYRALKETRGMVRDGQAKVAQIKRKMRSLLSAHVDKIDYLEIVDAETLANVSVLQGHIVVLVAVYVGTTRLIDNLVMRVTK